MTDTRARKPDAAGKTSGKKKKKSVNPWVENIESLCVAVILALIIRTFVVEAFIIPTGSMAPTLYGNHLDFKCPNCGFAYAFGFNDREPVCPERVRCPMCGVSPGIRHYTPDVMPPLRYSGGDKILVNKIPYLLDGPRRWDPFVFVNPNAGRDNPPKTTYIKRLVGMPGETLEILRGDVVVDGRICRKTESAQKSLWMPVYDIRYVWKQGSAWAMPDDGTWSLDGKRLEASCPPGESSWVRYAGRIGDPADDRGVIRDTYGYDHDRNVIVDDVVRRGAGVNVVTDIRIAFDLTVSGNGRIELALPFGDDETDYDDRAVLDLAAGKAVITRSGRELHPPVGLPALADGRKHHVSFQRLDYLLVLAIDGEKTLECDVWDDAAYRRWVQDAAVDRLGGWRRSGVALGASDVKLVLTDLRIDRDVYYMYRESHHHAWRIPEGCCFAMGDNSPESYDSRYWKDLGGNTFVPMDHLIGRGLVIWWHPMRLRLIR